MTLHISRIITYEEKKFGERALLQIRPNGSAGNTLTGRRMNADYTFRPLTRPAFHSHQFPAELADTVLDGQLAGGVYWFFDLLRLAKRDVRHLPLLERKRLLASIAPQFPAFLRPIPCDNDPARLLRQVIADGEEGIVGKDLTKNYAESWWTGSNLSATFYCVIRRVNVIKRSFALGQYVGAKLCAVGPVFSGVSKADAERAAENVGATVEISARLRRLENNALRGPVFIGFRPDVDEMECRGLR